MGCGASTEELATQGAMQEGVCPSAKSGSGSFRSATPTSPNEIVGSAATTSSHDEPFQRPEPVVVVESTTSVPQLRFSLPVFPPSSDAFASASELPQNRGMMQFDPLHMSPVHSICCSATVVSLPQPQASPRHINNVSTAAQHNEVLTVGDLDNYKDDSFGDDLISTTMF